MSRFATRTGRCWLPWCLALVSLVVASAARPAHAQDHDVGTYFVQSEGGLSFLSDAADQSFLAGAVGYAFRAGWREAPWGVFAHVGQDMWLTSEVNQQLIDGVLNMGVGGEFFYFDRHLRASLALGTSTLLFDTILDEEGTTGLFVDVRPVGFRWGLTEWMTVELNPLTYCVQAPVLSGLPLVRTEYRTVIVLEAHR